VTANDIVAWHDFFVMAGGGAAALIGLLFVALSINLHHVMGTPGVTSRAATFLIGLVTILFSSAVALIPDQSPRTFGIELLIIGFIGIALDGMFRRRFMQPTEFLSRGHNQVVRYVLLTGATIPAWIASISLLEGWPRALDWLALSYAFLLYGGISGSWILLVELPLWVARNKSDGR
jgi:modulator of FtsH protease